MGFGPLLCADRRGRMSGRRAGCLGLHGEPDVRADGAGHGALWNGLSGFLGASLDVRVLTRRRMSGADAECLGHVALRLLDCCCSGCLQRPDVRGWGRMSGPWSCLLLLSAFLFIRGLGGLSVFTCIARFFSIA